MKIASLCIAALIGALPFATPVLAQGVTGGLFGATRSDSGARDTLNLQMTLSEALDSEVAPEFRSRLPGDDLRVGRHSTVLAGAADFARDRHNLQLFGSTSTYFTYNHSLSRLATGSQGAQLGASVPLPKRGAFSITQGATYAPSYLYQLFPSDSAAGPDQEAPVNPEPEYRIDQTESFSYRTRMSLAFGPRIGRRLTTTASYSLADFRKGTVSRPDQATYDIETRFARHPSRRGGLSVAYRYRAGESGSDTLTRGHEVSFGAEYSPAISVSRRLTFRLEVTPSLLDVPASTPGTPPDTNGPAMTGRRRSYPVQASASVDYPFRLKWRTTAGYTRGVSYLALLSEPVFTDAARVGLIGVIGRRVDVSAQARYATSESAIVRAAGNLTTYTGEFRFRFALSRSFALYSEYLYYYYDLGGQTRIAPGLPRTWEQHGVRVGVTLFTQAFGR